MKIKKLLWSLLATSALALAAAPSLAADFKERTLRFSFVQPLDSHMGFGAQKFADLVARKSGNKIAVKLFPNGTLGGDLQTVSALQGGTLDMTTLPPGLLVGLSKEFGAFDLPFLFDSFAEADAVLDGPIGKRFIDRLPQGLVGLTYWDHGFRNVSNNRRPIARMEDFQGLKLRSLQAPLMLETFNTLGANAVPMPFTELYTALESRAVDGQDNPIVAFASNKFYEVQKQLSLTRHVYNPLVVLVSKKAWDQLSADERKLLTDAAAESRVEQRTVSRGMEAKAIEEVKKKGVTVTDISPQERARMRDKVKPVSDKYVKDIGEELVKAFYTEIDKVRGEVVTLGPMRILLAEDERELATWLVRALAQSDFQVDWVDDGRLVRRSLKATRYDALILDLGLPGLGGHDVLADLREADQRLPVLILTARDSLLERVSSLNEGADDFLAKPFELAELEARLVALIRRARGSDQPRFSCGSLAYDAGTKQFRLGHEPLVLTPREHAVLRALIQHSGEPLSKQEILDRVFSDEQDVQPDVVEVLVHRLRKRLQASAVGIRTLRGLGYVLEGGH